MNDLPSKDSAPQLWRGTPEEQRALADLATGWGHWSYEEVVKTASQSGNRLWYLVDVNGGWCGMLLASLGRFEAELLWVYVRPSVRRQGLSSVLMDAFMKAVSQHLDIEAVFLEVRATNLPALRLYERFGLESHGVRRGYYKDGEDALLFRRVLPKR